MKHELKSSVITFYRKDSEDRERNLKILLDFYQKHYDNFEFIVAEQKHLQSNIDFSSYKFVNHIELPTLDNSWNKMLAYNEAVKNAFHEKLIFNDIDVILSEKEAVKKKREEVLYLCTGSQGEPRGAMMRIANQDFPHVDIDLDDTIIFSSKIIESISIPISRSFSSVICVFDSISCCIQKHVDSFFRDNIDCNVPCKNLMK